MCGSYQFPWVVKAQPGQRLNITLLDLSWTSDPKPGSVSQGYCNPYGSVREFLKTPVEGEKTQDICSSALQRFSHVYASTGDNVELVVHNPGSQNFMIIVNGQLTKSSCGHSSRISFYSYWLLISQRHISVYHCQVFPRSQHSAGAMSTRQTIMERSL
jgi:hypothetical protein